MRKNLAEPLKLREEGYGEFLQLAETNIEEYLTTWKAANKSLDDYEASIDRFRQVPHPQLSNKQREEIERSS